MRLLINITAEYGGQKFQTSQRMLHFVHQTTQFGVLWPLIV